MSNVNWRRERALEKRRVTGHAIRTINGADSPDDTELERLRNVQLSVR
jgi:hypothetical protein